MAGVCCATVAMSKSTMDDAQFKAIQSQTIHKMAATSGFEMYFAIGFPAFGAGAKHVSNRAKRSLNPLSFLSGSLGFQAIKEKRRKELKEMKAKVRAKGTSIVFSCEILLHVAGGHTQLRL